MTLKFLLYLLTPPLLPVLWDKISGRSGKARNSKHNMYSGNFASWKEAAAGVSGYDASVIFEKTKSAAIKVKRKEAAYERDSVLFDKIHYSWPLVYALQKVAGENQGEISLIDFGGSLGSSYFQNLNFLKTFSNVKWSVVEQRQYADCGSRELENKELKFHYDIDRAIAETKPRMLLLSSVIQYLEEPFDYIRKFLSFNFEYVFIDRTSFILNSATRILVQKVDASIYEASYPVRFFNENELLACFLPAYEIIAHFDSFCDFPVLLEDGKKGYWKGFFLKRKK